MSWLCVCHKEKLRKYFKIQCWIKHCINWRWFVIRLHIFILIYFFLIFHGNWLLITPCISTHRFLYICFYFLVSPYFIIIIILSCSYISYFIQHNQPFCILHVYIYFVCSFPSNYFKSCQQLPSSTSFFTNSSMSHLPLTLANSTQ